MENTAAYEQLFLDADKYQAVMRALADRLYKELHDDKQCGRYSSLKYVNHISNIIIPSLGRL